MTSLAQPCPCGSFEHELIAGTELRLKDVEVACSARQVMLVP